MMSTRSRRDFMKTTAAVAAISTLPKFNIASCAAPGKKLNMAVVGAGGMGGYAVGVSARENFVAICDVDEKRAAGAFKNNPNVPKFKDFRVMLDKMGKEIDAVCISTPDHIHFPAAMAAMEMGKHVFVQKPLAHNVWQVRTMRKAAQHYKVLTQMGNQGHTFDGIRRIKEWVDAGLIGEVREIHTWTNRPRMPWFQLPTSIPPKPAPVPETLAWDLWQGPTTARPYSPEYLPSLWRGWWDYGCASLGDIGCHTFDAPFWALDLGQPTRVEVEVKEKVRPEYMPWGAKTTFYFPARGKKPPVKLIWFEDGFDVPTPKGWEGKFDPREGGMVMLGSKETLYHDGMRPQSPKIIPSARMNDLRPAIKEIERIPSAKAGPIEEWVRAIKEEGPKPGSTFDYAAPLTEMVLLGALAQRIGKAVDYDAENMKVTNVKGLEKYIKEPVREGWSYGEGLWK